MNSQNETPHPYLQYSSSRLGKFSNSVLFPFAMYKHGFRGGGSGPHPLENYKIRYLKHTGQDSMEIKKLPSRYSMLVIIARTTKLSGVSVAGR